MSAKEEMGGVVRIYRNVDSPRGDFGLVKQEGDEAWVAYRVGATDPIYAIREALRVAEERVDALRAERDEAVALLGEVRDHFAALGDDAEGPHPMVDRIDAIVARRKA